MAAAGDHSNVDFQMGDVPLPDSATNEDSVYTDLRNEAAPQGTVFFFGKVSNTLANTGNIFKLN